MDFKSNALHIMSVTSSFLHVYLQQHELCVCSLLDVVSLYVPIYFYFIFYPSLICLLKLFITYRVYLRESSAMLLMLQPFTKNNPNTFRKTGYVTFTMLPVGSITTTVAADMFTELWDNLTHILYVKLYIPPRILTFTTCFYVYYLKNTTF